jgi:hypothetical protein
MVRFVVCDRTAALASMYAGSARNATAVPESKIMPLLPVPGVVAAPIEMLSRFTL